MNNKSNNNLYLYYRFVGFLTSIMNSIYVFFTDIYIVTLKIELAVII
jgi:hypothetical protein